MTTNKPEAAGADDTKRGLYDKFTVTRNDNKARHNDCEYFVLDWRHDKHALAAIAAYIKSCRKEYPALAADLLRKLEHYKTLREMEDK